MRVLIELTRIVKNINLKPKNLLITDNKKKTRIQEYYEKILAGDFQTDADAAAFFFNDNPSHSSYKNLKLALRKKLINTLSFYELKQKSSDYGDATFFCSKNFLAGKLLLTLSAKNAGIDLCQKVLKKALAVEYTEYIVAASKELRVAVGTQKGDIKKFDYYNKLYKEYQAILEAENIAEEYYYLLVLPYAKSKEKKADTHELAIKYYQQLLPFLTKYNSPRLHMLGRNIQVIGYLAINDYETVVKLCKKAYLFFKQKTYSYNTPIRVFAHNELISYIQLRNYALGKEAAMRAISTIKSGETSWYTSQELYLMLALHSKEYNEAYYIFMNVIKSSNFSSLPFYYKERWEIHQIYVYFLIFIKKITVSNKQRFRIGKFLNSVPVYSQDKRGLNIPILITQILFMIVKKDYDQAIDRFEAIKKYCSRYIRKSNNLRSNCFINMLLQIPNSSFHKAGVERKAQKYYDQLLATPLDVAGQAYEVEIIPYEDLWTFIVESLETKQYKQ